MDEHASHHICKSTCIADRAYLEVPLEKHADLPKMSQTAQMTVVLYDIEKQCLAPGFCKHYPLFACRC